jgi:hypothetical protein
MGATGDKDAVEHIKKFVNKIKAKFQEETDFDVRPVEFIVTCKLYQPALLALKKADVTFTTMKDLWERVWPTKVKEYAESCPIGQINKNRTQVSNLHEMEFIFS